MEIKKSKKLLSALIATSFVGIAVTPIVLTSCSKKDNSFKGFIASSVMNKAKVEGKFIDEKKGNIAFTKFDENGVATLALVPGDNEKNCKEFTITLELPFEVDTTDETKKLFEVSAEAKTKGLNEGGKDFIDLKEQDNDGKNKKLKSWKVTISPSTNSIKPNEVEKEGKKVSEVSYNNVYSEITFTFENKKKDAKDDDKTCKFVYKITYSDAKKEESEKK